MYQENSKSRSVPDKMNLTRFLLKCTMSIRWLYVSSETAYPVSSDPGRVACPRWCAEKPWKTVPVAPSTACKNSTFSPDMLKFYQLFIVFKIDQGWDASSSMQDAQVWPCTAWVSVDISESGSLDTADSMPVEYYWHSWAVKCIVFTEDLSLSRLVNNPSCLQNSLLAWQAKL